MDVVDVFLWFANESFLAAEEANEQRQREIFLQLGSLWADAANQAAVPNANVAGVGAPERAVRNGGYVRSLASPTSLHYRLPRP